MSNAIVQMADGFLDICNRDFAVEKVFMHSDDFKSFVEQYGDDIELTGAPWEPGEMVALLWGAEVWLTHSVVRRGEIHLEGALDGETVEITRGFWP